MATLILSQDYKGKPLKVVTNDYAAGGGSTKIDNRTIVSNKESEAIEVAIDNSTIVYDDALSAIKIPMDDRITNISNNAVKNSAITEKILQLETMIQLLMENKQTIPITDRAGLENISANLTADYVIMNDIDMGDKYWTGPKNFAGSINGNCHTIRNLKLASVKYNGLIGKTAAGSTVKIRDLNIENVTMDLQDNYAGVKYTIVSKLSANSLAVLRDGTTVPLERNTVYICKDDPGGDNWYVDADGNVDGYEPGGAAFIGQAQDNSTVVISNCKASGNLGVFNYDSNYNDSLSDDIGLWLTEYYPLGHQAAGFIARFNGFGLSNTLTITNCENNVNVFTEFNKAGGFNAMTYGNTTATSHKIIECINNGRVIGGKASAFDAGMNGWGGVAGFVGHYDVNHESPSFQCDFDYCINNGDIVTFSTLNYAVPYNYYGNGNLNAIRIRRSTPANNEIHTSPDECLSLWRNEYQWNLSAWEN